MFICSTSSNLNNFKPQQLQPQKRVQNGKKQTSRPSKTHEGSPDSPTFFGTMRLFATFWIAPKGPPSFGSISCNTMEVKNRKGSPFYIFRQCDTVQKDHKKFFWKIFSCHQRVSPSIFFHFLQPAGVLQSPKGPPLQF